jgi:hypothetical protein
MRTSEFAPLGRSSSGFDRLSIVQRLVDRWTKPRHGSGPQRGQKWITNADASGGAILRSIWGHRNRRKLD